MLSNMLSKTRILLKTASHISIYFNALFLDGNPIQSYQKQYPEFPFTLLLLLV